MFAPIETIVPALSKQNLFLFSFRAVALEQFSKQSAYAALEVQRQMDNGQPFEVQEAIQQHLHLMGKGMERGLADINSWKNQYDLAYRANDYNHFAGYACIFSEILPVASCGAFHPEVSFLGERLQIISRGKAAFEHIAVSLAPLSGRTMLVMGWFGAKDGPAFRFAESFRALNDSAKANAAIHLAFEHMENTFLTPTWWEQLTEATQASLIRRMMTGMGLPGPDRNESSLTNLKPILSTASVEQEVLLPGAESDGTNQ